MRKALMSEQRKNQMQTEIKTLEDTCDRLNREIKQMEQEIEDMNRKDEEDRLTEQKAYEDKVNYLNDINAGYKRDLETLLSSPALAK